MPSEQVATIFHSDQVQRAYDKLAVDYATWFIDWIGNSDLPRPQAILDVGCRTGASTKQMEIASPGSTVIGIDVVPEYVEYAQEHGVAAYLHDVQKLSELGMTFDYAFVSQVLEHVEDFGLALSELHKNVRYAVFFGVPLETEEEFHENPMHHSHHSLWGWLDQLPRNQWEPLQLFLDTRKINKKSPLNYLNLVLRRMEGEA